MNNVGTIICRYELVDHNAIVKTEIETLKVKLYDQKHLSDLLTEVGFKNIKKIKAFDRNQQPNENDEVIGYECQNC